MTNQPTNQSTNPLYSRVKWFLSRLGLLAAALAVAIAVSQVIAWTAPTQSPPTESGNLAIWMEAKDLTLSISGTSVQVVASSSDKRRAPVVNAKFRVNSSTVSTTLSGSAGARYIFADLSGSSGFTLANSTSITPGTDQVLVGTAYWNGAAITHVWTVGKSSADYGIAMTQVNTTSSSYVDSGYSITITANGIDPVVVEVIDVAYVDNDSSGFTALVVDGAVVAEGHAGETGVGGHRSTTTLLRTLLLSAGAHIIKTQIKRIEGAGTYATAQGGGWLVARQIGGI